MLGKDTVLATSPGDHGMFMEYDEEQKVSTEQLVVYGMKGSDAEVIAFEEGFPFVALDE